MSQSLRDLGVAIGALPTGPYNAITDVPGVLVGHSTLIRDEPSIVRTGVTMIVPRGGDIWSDHATAGWFNFSGNGEMTGIPWIEESGLLSSPIGLTNTHQVGLVRDYLVETAVELGNTGTFHLPVVAETWDGWLSDIDSFSLTHDHADHAFRSATTGPVAQGRVGSGTGMICHEFKGGIGTSSRMVEIEAGEFTVGVLVQANYGRRSDLRVDGIPVGSLIPTDEVPSPWTKPPSGGSIIVIVGTDAPLLPNQCASLARRAVVGLAKVGGYGHYSSGDIFLAFSTGNHLSVGVSIWDLEAVPITQMDELYHAAADATEESILNALCAAETTSGQMGRIAHAMPLDRLREIVADRDG